MPIYPVSMMGGQLPQGGGGISQESFTVHVQSPSDINNINLTNISGSGEVPIEGTGLPHDIMRDVTGSEAPSSTLQVISNWISQNPILSIGIGIFGLMILKGG